MLYCNLEKFVLVGVKSTVGLNMTVYSTHEDTWTLTASSIVKHILSKENICYVFQMSVKLIHESQI